MSRPKRELPWLDIRGDTYYVFWYNEAKRRTDKLSLRTKDINEAKHRFAAFLTTGLDGTLPPSARANYLTRDALDAYMKEHIEVSTMAPKARRTWRKWLEQHFGDVPVRDIDIPMCRQYLKRRTLGEIGTKPAAASSVRAELAMLRAAIAHAVKWKRLDKHDVPTIELPPVPKGRERWLTHEELDALRAAAKTVVHSEEIADFIEIAYYTAGRRNSIETLTIFQVDFRTRRIDLHPPGRVETKKRKPIVPIFPEIYDIIERRVSRAKAENRPHLFRLKDLYPAFRKCVQAAGLPTTGKDKVTSHTLRHSRASHLLMRGVNPNAVAALLGDSVQTVLDVYGHFCPDYMRDAMNVTPVYSLADFSVDKQERSADIKDLLG